MAMARTRTRYATSANVMDATSFKANFDMIADNVETVIKGKSDVVRLALVAIMCEGHVLFEDLPGTGKSMLARALGESMDGATWSRVQCTPDMLPGDITGSSILDQRTGDFQFRAGPVFANILLADEINRATPKTQSALLEAMQEQSVTVAKKTHILEQPFLVLATQNPLEMEGTYPLPEAQLDRFFFKLHVRFPGREELHSILDRTTGSAEADVRPVLTRERILELRALARAVPVARSIQDYAVRILLATHPEDASAPEMVKRYVRFGASPRGAQAVLLAAKIRALMEGRFSASAEDVRRSCLPALRHRVLMNFEGEAEGVRTDAVLEQIVAAIKDVAA